MFENFIYQYHLTICPIYTLPDMTPNYLKSLTIYSESVESTNDELRKRASKEDLPNLTCFITDNQTAGKGQVGNKWESEPNKNLTFSVLLHPTSLPILKQFLLSKMVSVAITQALEHYIPEVSIKWPNDIYVGDKKICGILIENSIMGDKIHQSIIGIGLNVNQTTFISDAPNPISIQMATEKELDLDEVFHHIMDQIEIRFAQLMAGCTNTITHIYFDKLYRREGYFKYKDENGVFMAKIEEVKDLGFMVLKRQDGTLSEYSFKEVEFVQ